MKSRHMARLIMMASAAITRAGLVSLYQEPSAWDFINGMVLGLVIVQLALLLEEEFSLDTWSFSAVLLILTSAVGSLLLMGLYLVEYEIFSLNQSDLGYLIDRIFARVHLNPAEYIFLTTVAILLIRGPNLNRPKVRKGLTSEIAYDEPELNPRFTQTTRFLSAALLLDNEFRKSVVDFFERKQCAFAPELGIDVAKLARLSYLLAARQRRYDYLFLLVFTLSFILFFFESRVSLLFVFVLSILLTAYQAYEQNVQLIPLVKKNAYGPDRLERILRSRYKANNIPSQLPTVDQNLLIYSGFTPFVGAGYQLDDTEGWSFPINISRPKEFLGDTRQIKPFNLKDLYDCVVLSINRCGFRGFIARDYLFLHGTQAHSFPWILPDVFSSPKSQVSDAYINQYISQNSSVVRYYKWLQFHDWSNEIVVSYILRFSKRGEYLFVEVSRFLLTPLWPKFRLIDELPQVNRATFVKVGLTGLFICLPSLVWGSINGIRHLVHMPAEWLNNHLPPAPLTKNKQDDLREQMNHNFGASESLRVMVSSAGFSHYFQRLDKEMYFKVVEKQILEAINAFLEVHNIDTSDLQARQTTILNNGIIVQGQGKIEAEAVAAGERAQAKAEVTRATISSADAAD